MNSSNVDVQLSNRQLNILLIENILRLVKNTRLTRDELYCTYSNLFSKDVLDVLAKFPQDNQLKRLSYLISYAKNRDLVSEYRGGNIELTQRGLKRLRTYTLRSIQIPYQKWDGTWRVVLYDVPESKRVARLQMTSKLRQLGFYMYQRSVWIHPFECRDTVRFLASTFDMQPYITFIEATSVDHEGELRLHFKRLLSLQT